MVVRNQGEREWRRSREMLMIDRGERVEKIKRERGQLEIAENVKRKSNETEIYIYIYRERERERERSVYLERWIRLLKASCPRKPAITS